MGLKPVIGRLLIAVMGIIVGAVTPFVIDLIFMGMLAVAYHYLWLWLIIALALIWLRLGDLKQHGWLDRLFAILCNGIAALIIPGGLFVLVAGDMPPLPPWYPHDVSVSMIPYIYIFAVAGGLIGFWHKRAGQVLERFAQFLYRHGVIPARPHWQEVN